MSQLKEQEKFLCVGGEEENLKEREVNKLPYKEHKENVRILTPNIREQRNAGRS